MLAERKAKLVMPEPKVKTGYLARYAKPGHLCGQGCRLEDALNRKALIFCSGERPQPAGGEIL